MKKYEVRVESVTRFYVEAETAEQAEAIVAKDYKVDFDADYAETWDSWDEYEVTELDSVKWLDFTKKILYNL